MSDDPLVGTVLGQYRIERVIGKGGMATVYQSTQVAVNRTVAIKVLPSTFMHDETFMTRFRQEAEVAAQLEHIHILPVYDFGEHDGIPYIVMRYLDGGTLRERTQQGPLDPLTTLNIIRQVAQALDYAHSRNVIHRDLKPSNIMLDSNDNAFLTDFGTAKLRDRSAQLTGSGIVGTPAYMAPEQSMPGPLSPSVDVYALGVTLFEMITGNVPYSADTPIVQILMHIQHPVPSLHEYNPSIPDVVDEVVKTAMAKKPEERYLTAVELAEALAQAIRVSGGWSIGGEEGVEKRLQEEIIPLDTGRGTPHPNNISDAKTDRVEGTTGDEQSAAGGEAQPVISPVQDHKSYDLDGLSGSTEGQPASAHGKPVLQTQDGKVFELPSSNTLIGRSDERRGIFVDIELTDLDIKKRSSRSHARILERDGEYIVWDLHSMNGTFVNGQRLPEGGRMEIRPGDAIQFGKDGVIMLFQH